MYSLLALLLFVVAIPFVRRMTQIVSIVLVLAGVYFFYSKQMNVFYAVSGFGHNINLLTLFILVPLIGVYISTAGYLTALKEYLEQSTQKKHPYRLSFMLTALMGAVLNIGSMAIVNRIAEGSFQSFYRTKLLLVVLRTFGFCMIWSPYFVNVGLVLFVFNVGWKEIAGVGFIIGLLYLCICFFFFKGIHFSHDVHYNNEENNDFSGTKHTIRPFVFFFVGLFVLSFFFDAVTNLPMLTIVCLLGLFYPLVWAVLTKQWIDYIHDVIEFMLQSFSRLKNELVIFISAGFFGRALAETNAGQVISQSIYDWSLGSVFMMSVLVIVLSILLALIGIHPVVIVIGIGGSLSPSVFGVSAAYMAMLLLVAWTLATQLSPFSGSVLMASSLAKRSPVDFSKQNIAFVATSVVLLSIVLYGLHRFTLI